ncbi:glycoside hydrolase family 114 protein, partial [Piromyces sp. E2]
LHGKGQKAICYFSGGTSEKNKPDYEDYKKAGVFFSEKSSYGNYYIDIRKLDKLRPLLKNRFRRAYNYGCDGVEVDSIGVHSHVNTITKNDTINFAKMLSEIAHAQNISVGLKNTSSLVGTLEPYFDFAVVESCAAFSNECNSFEMFTKHDKAVFVVHY